MRENSQEGLVITTVLVLLFVIPVCMAELWRRRRAARRLKLLAGQDEFAVPTSPSLIRGWLKTLFVSLLVFSWFIWFLSPKKNPRPLRVADNNRGQALNSLIVASGVIGAAVVIFAGAIWVRIFRHSDRDVNRACGQANAGNIEGAIAELERQVNAKGPSAARANALGCLMVMAKKWDEASRMFDVAEQLGADPVLTQYNRGMILLETGNPEAALPLLEGAIQARPDEIVIQCNLSRALEELGRIEEAQQRLFLAQQQRKAIYFLTADSRRSIDRLLQQCHDRLASRKQPDLTSLDEL